jgi:hypothetical protein
MIKRSLLSLNEIMFTAPPVTVAVFHGPILPGDDRDSEHGGRRLSRWTTQARDGVVTLPLWTFLILVGDDEGTCDRVLDD